MRNITKNKYTQANSEVRTSAHNKGTTLFEVLLYIGLFCIISTATVYLYISILKASDTLTQHIQKNEISIFVRQLAMNQLDASSVLSTSPFVDTQKLKSAMERILKYYPNLKLVDIQAEYIYIESNPQIIDVRIGTNLKSTVKLTYQLQSQSRSRKVFSNYAIISSI